MNALTQIYSVDVLHIGKRKLKFDGAIACQMFVTGPKQAELRFTNPYRALDGVINGIAVTGEGMLTYIEYTIIGSPKEGKVGVQRYKHGFKSAVTVTDTGDGDVLISSRSGALFIPYQLDVLLDSTEFGKVQGIQFIA